MPDKQTVFIVDDDEAVRDSLSLLMRSVALDAEAFSSAQEFLDAFDAAAPAAWCSMCACRA
ncbi:MAG: hypothetical protein U1F68_11490 [Gammaproteobacteria bacterium]